MGLRVVIGYPTQTKENPFPVYVGNSAAEAAAARYENTSAAHFDIIENPGSYRKGNGNYKPESSALPPLTVQPDPDNRRVRR